MALLYTAAEMGRVPDSWKQRENEELSEEEGDLRGADSCEEDEGGGEGEEEDGQDGGEGGRGGQVQPAHSVWLGQEVGAQDGGGEGGVEGRRQETAEQEERGGLQERQEDGVHQLVEHHQGLKQKEGEGTEVEEL